MGEGVVLKACANCGHYCGWFRRCFSEEDGVGFPINNNFRGDQIGDPAGICDLYTPATGSKNRWP